MERAISLLDGGDVDTSKIIPETGSNALHVAVLCVKPILAKLLLGRGVDVNKLRDNGYKALLMAVLSLESVDTDASRSIIEDLIAFGASLEVVEGILGMQPIHFAVMIANQWLVECLCRAKVEVDSKPPNGYAPLYCAIQKVLDGSDARRSIVTVLIKAGASIETAEGAHGQRPIHSAVESGNAWLVDCLCRNGAEIVSKLTGGATALHRACLHNNRVVAKQLIEADADVNMTDNEGDTPLIYMVYRFSSQNISFADFEETANLLLAAGADVDAKMRGGYAALHVALLRCCVFGVKHMIRAGTDVNISVERGLTPVTPLKMAVSEVSPPASEDVDAADYVDIVDALLLAGADERHGAWRSGGMANDLERKISTGNGSDAAAQRAFKKLLFCPTWRSHKLLFLIRGRKRIGWPAPEEDKRRTKSARKNEVLAWLLSKDGGAPEDVFRNVMSFIVPKTGQSPAV